MKLFNKLRKRPLQNFCRKANRAVHFKFLLAIDIEKLIWKKDLWNIL